MTYKKLGGLFGLLLVSALLMGMNVPASFWQWNGTTLRAIVGGTILGELDGSGNASFPGALAVVATTTTRTNLDMETAYQADSYAGKYWECATTTANFLGTDRSAAVVYDGKMWTFGGSDYQTSYFSSNGTDWFVATSTPSNIGARFHFDGVVFANKMWAIGGKIAANAQSGVLWSTDAITWTIATTTAFPARYGHGTCVFNSKLWVIGGYPSAGNYCSDVWSSSDGTTWTVATTTAAFGARAELHPVVFAGKMWVIGGYNGTNKNDAWSSSDGITWVQTSVVTPFTIRAGNACFVYGGKMWVVGGVSFNDVWSSPDGATWTRVNANCPWPVAYYLNSVVFAGKMWVFNGNGMGRSVWYSGNSSEPPNSGAELATYTGNKVIAGSFSASGPIRSTGNASMFSDGTGVESFYANGSGTIRTFDHAGAVHTPMNVDAMTMYLNTKSGGDVVMGANASVAARLIYGAQTTYADNEAAKAGGLATGTIYRITGSDAAGVVW